MKKLFNKKVKKATTKNNKQKKFNSIGITKDSLAEMIKERIDEVSKKNHKSSGHCSSGHCD